MKNGYSASHPDPLSANILGQPEPKPYPTFQLELRAREKIHKQTQSTLLSRLPLEIRVMIYEMVLLDLGHTRHIQFEDGRLLGVKCVANMEEPTLLVDASHCSDWGMEHASCQELAGLQRDPGILRTVMRVCRGLAGIPRGYRHE